MSNLWAFLLQTTWASLAALLVKKLLEDKLSPRWQYAVWSVLALRILIPGSLGRYVVLPLSAWLELAKTLAERHLSSAYAAPYVPIEVRAPWPVLTGRPDSVTDWLFAAYTAGVMAVLLWYCLSYLLLSSRRRRAVPAAVQEKVDGTAARYGLPPARPLPSPAPPRPCSAACSERCWCCRRRRSRTRR